MRLSSALIKALAVTVLIAGCGGGSGNGNHTTTSGSGESGDKVNSVNNQNISISSVNSRPVASDARVDATTDGDASLTLTAVDQDGDPITYKVVKAPEHGTLKKFDQKTGTFVYKPQEGYSGEDKFQYVVSDEVSESDVKTVYINVKDIDETSDTTIPNAPTSLKITDVTACSAKISWQDNSDNEDGFEVYVLLDDGGSKLNGIFFVNQPNDTSAQIHNLKPNQKYLVIVKAKNCAGKSEELTATFTTKAVATPPKAPTDLKVVSKNDKCVRLSWKDNADNESGYEIYQDGKLLKTIDANCHCTLIADLEPDTNYHFEVKAINSAGSSDAASIDVKTDAASKQPTPKPTPKPQPTPNKAPTVATDGDKVITIGDSVLLKASASDSDGEIVKYEWKEGDTVLGDKPELNYTPTTTGEHKLVITVTDDDNATASSAVKVKVKEKTKPQKPNQPPVADAGEDKSTEVGKAVTLTGSGTDSDGNVVSYEWKEGNTVLGSTATLNYTPTTEGEHKLVLTVTDDKGATDSDEVIVTAKAKPKPQPKPDTTPPIITLKGDKTITITEGDDFTDPGATATDDKDGDITSKITKSGSVDTNKPGTYTITYSVSDSAGNKADPVTRTVIVKEKANQAPTADAGEDKSVEVNKSVTLTGSGSDSDGQVVKYEWKEGDTVLGSSATLTYTPSSVGKHTLVLTVTDDDGATGSDTVVVTATEKPNQAPTANPQSTETNEDTAKTITLSGSDPDGDSLTYAIVSQPSHGTVTISGNQATYTPNANYHGSDSFTFKVNDGKADSAPATVNITVNATNDKPTANPQSVTMDEDTSKEITLSGSDPDGDTLTYRITKNPNHGSVTLSGNKATYTPAHNYNGSDSFEFVVNDGTVDSDPATVNITINDVPEPNQAPTITSLTANPTTAEEGETITFTADATDPDNDTLTYTWDNGLGTGKTVSTNSLSVGTHTITVTVDDGHNHSVSRSVQVEVKQKQDPYADGWVVAKSQSIRDQNIELNNGDYVKLLVQEDKQIGNDDISADEVVVYGNINGNLIQFDVNKNYENSIPLAIVIYHADGSYVTSKEITYDNSKAFINFGDINY